MPDDRHEIDDLKALAQQRAPNVLGALGLNAKPRGPTGYVAVCDPVCRETRPSLVIWTQRPGGISFKRYGGFAQGDVFGLVAYLKGWWDLPRNGFLESKRFLEDLLGIRRMTLSERAADSRKARAVARAIKHSAEHSLERDRGRAFALWLQRQDWRGSPVESYLETRGIDLRGLPRAPQILGYLPDDPHTDAHGAVSAWPCMVVGCTDAGGRVQAVHRTWLARDGRGKAPVAPARKVWPAFGGLVMPLWRGDTGLSVNQAIANGLLETFVLVEGVEDGFSAVVADPKLRTWAMISLGNLVNVAAMLPACCDSVILHRQNDWNHLDAVAAFERGKTAIEATGRPVAELVAVRGKDINDTLRGEA